MLKINSFHDYIYKVLIIDLLPMKDLYHQTVRLKSNLELVKIVYKETNLYHFELVNAAKDEIFRRNLTEEDIENQKKVILFEYIEEMTHKTLPLENEVRLKCLIMPWITYNKEIGDSDKVKFARRYKELILFNVLGTLLYIAIISLIVIWVTNRV